MPDFIVPQFPFTPDQVQDAEAWYDLIHSIRDESGLEIDNYTTLLRDEEFGAIIASFWVFLAGRAPEEKSVRAMLADLLRVTDRHVTQRVKSGATPF